MRNEMKVDFLHHRNIFWKFFRMRQCHDGENINRKPNLYQSLNNKYNYAKPKY